MSTDGFRKILFSAGEQVLAADFNRVQDQLMSMIQDMYVYPGLTNALARADDTAIVYDPEQRDAVSALGATDGTDMCYCPFVGAGIWGPNGVANQVDVLAGGPLCQIINSIDPTEGPRPEPDDVGPVLLTFWTPVDVGPLTTSVGHVTHPRIDIVQMKLEEIENDAEDRVTQTEGDTATLDLGSVTVNIDTVISARSSGDAWNEITIAFVNDGAGVGSLTLSGLAYTFHFDDAVTTVADFEDAIGASDLLIVTTPGTGANTFDTGDDTLAATPLAGGVDMLILGSSVNKSKRVQATFSIKEGTAAATPMFPEPDAGYVPVAGIKVPANHNAVHTSANMMDMRWPIGGVRYHDVMYNELTHQTVDAGADQGWIIDHDDATAFQDQPAGPFPSTYAHAPGGMGRLVGIAVTGMFNSGGALLSTWKLVKRDFSTTPPTETNRATLQSMEDNFVAQSTNWITNWSGAWDISDEVGNVAGYDRLDDSRVGPGLWTDGSICGSIGRVESPQTTDIVTAANQRPSKLAFKFTLGTNDNVKWNMIRFAVAYGLGGG